VTLEIIETKGIFYMDGTLIGETMKIKGDITSKETLQLNGELEGTVELNGRLTIGPKGKAAASIKANEVDIAGAVTGNIDATERIMLRNCSRLPASSCGASAGLTENGPPSTRKSCRAPSLAAGMRNAAAFTIARATMIAASRTKRPASSICQALAHS